MTDLDSYRWLIDIAVGGVSSVAGWLAGRKQKDNSFLRLVDLMTKVGQRLGSGSVVTDHEF